MFTFLRAFSDIPGVECRKKFRGYRTLILFVNYSENHRFFRAARFHGRNDRQRYAKYFASYFISQKLTITEAEEF